MSIEVVYFNGTTYRKVVAPFNLTVWAPEVGNDFATAKIISPGKYLAYLDDTYNAKDYYGM